MTIIPIVPALCFFDMFTMFDIPQTKHAKIAVETNFGFSCHYCYICVINQYNEK